jgi:dipeptidase E
MRLLLTSNGLANDSLRTALQGLVGHTSIKIAFIPTAANVEPGDKEWLIHDLVNSRKMGPVDIVDISAMDREQWLPRLEAANVILIGGGNTFHLMHWLTKSGLADKLPELLKTRVYVGISAGSMVTNPLLVASQSKVLYYEGLTVAQDVQALGFVPFFTLPHLNSQYFFNVRLHVLEEQAKTLSAPLYALDDESAVQVIDGNATVVSEGEWKLFQK